jgi:uncharacterized membrane protein
MNETQTYNLLRILVAVFVAGGMAVALIGRQILVAVAIPAVALMLLWMVRGRHRTIVLKDERVKRIQEKAASTTLVLFLVAGAVTIMAAYVLEALGFVVEPLRAAIEPLGQTLIGLMLAYGAAQIYYSRKM